MAIKGAALTALTFGTILMWSGIKGWSVTGTIQDIVAGKQPAGTTRPGTPIATPATPAGATGTPATTSGGATGAGATVQALTQDALHYQGHPYVYGGSPGADGSKGWDCSSCMNWIISHDMGLPWPGSGRYDGLTHGPPTGSWAAWFLARGGGSTTVPFASKKPGDIIVWAGHMGMVITDTTMLSAETPANGTLTGGFVGSGPLLCVGRLPGVS